MRLGIRLRIWLEDQRGLSLIEILGAVTIMSIISVTLMGYFITGMNHSEEQSRRIIAANLARLKVAEIRSMVKPQAVYDYFIGGMTGGRQSYDAEDAMPPVDNEGHRISLQNENVNGTAYSYRVTLDRSRDQATKASVRNGELANQMTASADQYLIPMSITVYWGTDAESSAAKSTSVDTYVVNRGDH